MSKQFIVLLHETSHPGNIGASARAMKTMGIEKLRLVNTTDAEHSDAYAMASGADDILFKAQKYEKIPESIKDLDIVFGMSGRKRSNHHHCISSTEMAEILNSIPANNIGLLFGNEQNGLDNEALSYCQYQVAVPTNPNFSSLNVAACVQLICYICTSIAITPTRENEAMSIPQGQYQALVELVGSVIINTNMYNPQTFELTKQRIRQLVLHSNLTKDDIDLIMGILKQIKHLSQ